MSNITVKSVPSTQERNLPIFEEFDRITDQIRIRAYNLFADRGFGRGNDLADWLAAEQEICWPSAELVEGDDQFDIKVALAGFKKADISVTATPREIIIKASHVDEYEEKDDSKVRWSEFSKNDVYRYIELPSDINVEKITAEYTNGLLSVDAPKTEPEASQKKGASGRKTVNITS
jgi:HSP20 family protein